MTDSFPPYVELRCRSAFSFLDGASLPEDLAETAACLGHHALALSDRGGLSGAPRFFKAARKLGLQPIVGAEIAIEVPGTQVPPLLLLVENRTGYRNLCRLLTAMKAGRPKGEGTASHTLLASHADGLIALAGASPRDDVAELTAVFPAGHLYLEVQRHLDAVQEHRNRAVLALAAAHHLPVVATNDVRYALAQLRPVHDVLTCMRTGLTVDEIGRRLPCNAERFLKRPAEMAALFRDLPAALHATREIAERCAFTLADLGYTFPRYPVPVGETQQSFLEQMTWQGAAGRYRPVTAKVRAQLEHELTVIGKLNLAGYFLVVWDIVRFARDRGIMVQGRGSAANSATCYALGITAVDPVGMELLFERFLSEERVKSASNATDRMPDIDLDLPSGGQREAVIQYVYRKYGAHGTAMTANVICYRPRLAVRDCGRALGFAEEQLDRIARHLPSWIVPEDRPLDAFIAEAGFPPADTRTHLLADIATSMLNLPRHLGQHSGGMVIAAGRLDEIVPLEPARMPGRVVVQWDKDDCADLGIVKVDLLGLGMLAVLEESAALLRAHHGIEIDYAHLPPDDPAVYRMLRAADTVGVFQVESRAQMATLPRMRPERFYDLVVEVAIIRPGPIVGKMVNPYLARRSGQQPVRYPHPSLEPILRRTLGIPLFQEQLIRMAMTAAGFSGGQAEELRRAMGFKRSVERMKVIEAELRAGMSCKGIAREAQEEIVQGIKSFALYGFPESHAASFALIAYASAYLKAHHAAAFTCALLNNLPMGFYHPATLVKDAQRHGVPCLPVDVTCSQWACTLEDVPSPKGRGAPVAAVRLGLKYLRGLRAEVAQRLTAARPFSSLGDLCRRVELNAGERTTLAEVGAFAALGGTRRQVMWQVEAFGRSGELFAGVESGDAQTDSPLPDMSPGEEVAADFRGTGLTAGPHPMSFVRQRLQARGVLSARELQRTAKGQRALVAGLVIVRQRPSAAKGFVFVTIEDETGFANAIVSAAHFDEHRAVLVSARALVIGGVVQQNQGVTSLKADRFWPLDSAKAARDISHDFR
ncbi:MAG: error-prone DNA polymerase [Polyangia bacterium]